MFQGNVDINDTLDASSGTDGVVDVRVRGNWDATGGTFTNTSSTVMFLGTTSALTITSGTTSFNNFIMNDGLVGYWPLNETSSPSIDYSGYGNSLTWTNSPTSTTSVEWYNSF